jgi:gamma-glutamyltranspeptidase / glutathione hydrolase
MNDSILNINKKIKLIIIVFLIFLFVLIPASSYSQNQLNRKSILSLHGGVASADSLASGIGVKILEEGGNAADAATAVAMALAVVYPQAGNLGGGGFLVHRSSDNQIYVLDFRETAPAATSVDLYLDENGNVAPGRTEIGGLAVGVPGTVKGFYQFHQKFGKLAWFDVLEPAIKMAENGFPVSQYLAKTLRENEKYFKEFPPSELIFMPHGKNLEKGDILYQENLAHSLKEIALHGDEPFYDGEIGREIVKTVQMYGGVLSMDDLNNYRAVECDPVVINYKSYTIYTVPLPSSGGIMLSQILESLKYGDLDSTAFNSAGYVSLLSELEKAYFGFRNEYLGDPDYAAIPLNELLSPQLARKVSEGVRIGHPIEVSQTVLDDWLKESEETTHFSVVDSFHNAVSVTYTLNDNFGSKLVAGSTGILLNDEMDDFTFKPGQPNIYGLVQGEANFIEPGKRMLSSMCPVIITRGNELIGALGSPGGPKIITTVLQMLLNLIDQKMTLDDAIQAGRFHHQWLPDSIYIESEKFKETVLLKLEQWGYGLVKRDRIGDVQAIWHSDNIVWQLSSDPRGNGYPRGF